MSIDIVMKRPWVSFPAYVTAQAGYIGSPKWLAEVDADATKAAAPVGTGPFIFAEYKPGESFKVKKNPNYWLKPYPYLDEVEIRPVADALARYRGLQSGDLDLIHTTNGQTIKDLRTTAKDKFNITEVTNNAETAYTMLHATKAGSPISDQRVRCAFAYAHDMKTLLDKVQFGVGELAAGPFSPGQYGYNPKSGYPVAQDLKKAKELTDSWKKDNPGKKLTIELATTNDETNLTEAQAEKKWAEDAGFDEVTIKQFEQSNYITQALIGNFEVFQWRNHGGLDLDQQYIWWHSSTAPDPPNIALNFGRIKDKDLDALLDANRGEKDVAKKKEMALKANEIFAKQCYNVWWWHTVWNVAGKTDVWGTGDLKLPSGNTAAFGAGISGSFGTAAVYRAKA
jgi:peptide/nickel transport system substrate-binding protein